jgi:hypothetical protein
VEKKEESFGDEGRGERKRRGDKEEEKEDEGRGREECEDGRKK